MCHVVQSFKGCLPLYADQEELWIAASLIDGKPIVNLPARIVKLKQAEFSIDERSFYTNLEAESRAQFQVGLQKDRLTHSI